MLFADCFARGHATRDGEVDCGVVREEYVLVQHPPKVESSWVEWVMSKDLLAAACFDVVRQYDVVKRAGEALG